MGHWRAFVIRMVSRVTGLSQLKEVVNQLMVEIYMTGLFPPPPLRKQTHPSGDLKKMI